MRLFFIGLAVYGGFLLAFGFWVMSADAAVERHAICWGHREKPELWHWDVWSPQNHRWKATQRPCKRLWGKGFAVLDGNGNVVRIQKHRTYVVPAGPPPEQVAPPDVIADNNTTDG